MKDKDKGEQCDRKRGGGGGKGGAIAIGKISNIME